MMKLRISRINKQQKKKNTGVNWYLPMRSVTKIKVNKKLERVQKLCFPMRK